MEPAPDASQLPFALNMSSSDAAADPTEPSDVAPPGSICLERHEGDAFTSIIVRLSGEMSLAVPVVASYFKLDVLTVALRQKYIPFAQLLQPENGFFKNVPSVDGRGNMAYYEVLGANLKESQPHGVTALSSQNGRTTAQVGQNISGPHGGYISFAQPLQPIQQSGGAYFGHQYVQPAAPATGPIAPVIRAPGFAASKSQIRNVRFADGRLTGSSAASGYNAIVRTSPGAPDRLVKVTPQNWSFDYVLGEVRRQVEDDTVNLHYAHGPMLTESEVEGFHFWSGASGCQAKKVFFACKPFELPAPVRPVRGGEKRRKSHLDDVRDDIEETQDKLIKLDEKFDSFCQERDRLKARQIALKSKLADFTCFFCTQPFRAPPVACSECRFVYCAACSTRLTEQARRQRQAEFDVEPDSEDHSECPRCKRPRDLFKPLPLVWEGLEALLAATKTFLEEEI